MTIPEEDRPYGGLPGAEIVGLRNSQIQLAVAEVRYQHVGDIGSPQALKIRDALLRAGVEVIHVESTQRHEFTLAVAEAEAVPQATATTGWVLSNESRTLTVSLFPDLAFVQTTAYTRYGQSLRPSLQGVLDGLLEVFAPGLVQRVGLRYVNRLTNRNARAAADWEGSIAPAFLGVLADGLLGARVQSTQQQVEVALEAGVGALVRHGAFADHAVGGSYSYLVDLDVFRQVTDVFDPEAVLAVARRLNRTALPLFQHVVHADYRETMGPEPLARPETDLGPERVDERRPEGELP